MTVFLLSIDFWALGNLFGMLERRKYGIARAKNKKKFLILTLRLLSLCFYHIPRENVPLNRQSMVFKLVHRSCKFFVERHRVIF